MSDKPEASDPRLHTFERARLREMFVYAALCGGLPQRLDGAAPSPEWAAGHAVSIAEACIRALDAAKGADLAYNQAIDEAEKLRRDAQKNVTAAAEPELLERVPPVEVEQ